VRDKAQQISYWGPIWDRFRSIYKIAGNVPQHVLSTWYIFAKMSTHSHVILSNSGRCGPSQDRVRDNCPLVDELHPDEWMAKAQFCTVDQSS